MIYLLLILSQFLWSQELHSLISIIYISLHPLFLFDKTWIKNKRKTLISWRLIRFMLLLSTLPVRSDSTDCSAPCFRSTMIRVTFNLTQISDLIPISIDLQFIWLKRLANCSTLFFLFFRNRSVCSNQIICEQKVKAWKLYQKTTFLCSWTFNCRLTIINKPCTSHFITVSCFLLSMQRKCFCHFQINLYFCPFLILTIKLKIFTSQRTSKYLI